MKIKSVFLISIQITLSLCLIRPVYGQKTINKELVVIRSTNEKLNSVIVTTQLDTAQRYSKNGILFLIKIENKSKDTIEIVNPLDFIDVKLTNKSGIDVALPLRSRITEHWVNPKLFSYESFVVNYTQFNGTKIMGTSLAREITLPPNVPQIVSISIVNSLMQNPKYGSAGNAHSPLIPGKYKLLLAVSLVEAKDISTLLLKSIPIRYYK
ncbi:hypothetical protein [Hymenobacter sp.]|jgi:hypothetical protein|uniref:hypothetical protein n=1 Tax=Hymenobacter sp. TaxID=1898978 RepID=UPI002ED7FDC1